MTGPSASLPLSRAAERRAVRAVAAVEAAKGTLALLAASGLLSLVHRDVRALAIELVAYTHLNPAAHYPSVFIDAASRLREPRLLWLAAGAALYALLRGAEAWGLWGERAWAEGLAAASGAVYVPIEVVELWRHPGALGLGVLAANVAVVGVMLWALLARRERRR